MKKNRILIAVFCVAVVLLSFGVLHKFYVSVTQIDYNQSKGRIEISSRIFIDDLEKVLDKKYHQKLNLATRQESPKAKELIAQYSYNFV